MSDDPWGTIDDQLDRDFPESFIFDLDQAKDRFLGTMVRVDTGPSQYTDSGTVPIYVLKDKEGKEYGIWGIHQVLRDNFAEKRPQPGDLVGIKYLGIVKPKSGRGNGYHSYRIVVQPQGTSDPTIDWSLYGDAPQLAPAEDSGWSEPEPNDVHEGQGELPVEGISVERAEALIREAITTRSVSQGMVLDAFEAVGVAANSVGEALAKAQGPQVVSVAEKVTGSF